MKYINFKRYKFSTITKKLSTLRDNFLKVFKSIDFKIYDFKKITKYLDIRRFDYTLVTKYLDFKIYNINRIKRIKFFSSNFLLVHLPVSIIFFILLYLIIPTFYSYDKSDIESAICKKHNIKCLIKGEVNYSFYPTPRIKIKDLIINDFLEKENVVIEAENVAIKISIKNLLAKEKHQFKKIQLNNFKINFDLKNFKEYKNIFLKKNNLIPITFTKGQIIFSDGKDYVATINGVNLNLEFVKDSIEAILKGKFLDDNLYINFNSKKVDNKTTKDIILKMSRLNFLIKTNLTNSEKDKSITNGNILIKKNKNRITAIFDYKDNQLTINKSNLRNTFLDGKLEGKIKILPYFDFNLDINLNSLNFTKLYKYFLSLDSENKKKLFKINNKINGKLNLSSDKIYSSYNLIKSFESRINFNNGNILLEQFLVSLGKLGAADILGVIDNNKKFTNFKFESNIFVDNQKKFLSKFGIYNKQIIPSNLFVSGNFDLENIKTSFYEISDTEKFSKDDVDFIEKEFNDFLLEDGYESLFNFSNFKEFIKSITSATN